MLYKRDRGSGWKEGPLTNVEISFRRDEEHQRRLENHEDACVLSARAHAWPAPFGAIGGGGKPLPCGIALLPRLQPCMPH